MENNESLKGLKEKITEDINRNKVVRNARIKASERLRNYANRWGTVFFILNAIAVIYACTSISNIILKNHSKILSLVSTIFSLYVILLQDFISKKNYSERSLGMHYHQLQLKRINEKLIMLQLDIMNDNNEDKKLGEVFKIYYSIQEERNVSLLGYENHNERDYRLAKYEEKRKLDEEKGSKSVDKKDIKFWEKLFNKLKVYYKSKKIDFSSDNLLIYFQYAIIFLMIISYIFLVFKVKIF